MIRALVLFLLASPVFAAPKIDNLSVKANSKSPEVEIAIVVTKSGGNCDVRVDFGDGQGRTLDFGLATTRTLKYTYRKGGNYKVAAKGAGKSPCEGAREVAVSVAGPVEKKAAEKKAEKKKAEKKKADKKSAPKKEEPK
ncbi:MAG: hypothetical protein QOD26_2895 [Betaproteobacteria bacterium]|jgi:hypothetical protein|nr:hypothetical protein [Betaproteobacteria bacterium]